MLIRMDFFTVLEEHNFILEIFIREIFTREECKVLVFIFTKNLNNGFSVTSKAIILAESLKRGSSIHNKVLSQIMDS